jgi:hypothetical protein
MGLLTVGGLGPTDQKEVNILGPEITRVLRKAAAEIQKGHGRGQSQTWFGDQAQAWMIDLQNKLNKMASVINCEQIQVHGEAWKERSKTTFAASYEPKDGWGNYNSISRARDQEFEIALDIKWNNSIMYCTPANRDSKFQSLVHELTHLILGTDDIVFNGKKTYGTEKSKNLSASRPEDAKKNADNWGYFVEEFRI